MFWLHPSVKCIDTHAKVVTCETEQHQTISVRFCRICEFQPIESLEIRYIHKTDETKQQSACSHHRQLSGHKRQMDAACDR